MMNEWRAADRQNGESQLNLDERLAAYYGAELPEQPLPSSSWQHLRSRHGGRHVPRHRFARRLRLPRQRRRSFAPAFVQSAFANIVYEARVPYTLSRLDCSIKPRARIPLVHVTLLGRRNIRLTLPSAMEHAIESAELDVLLSTGLSRYHCMRKPTYTLQRLPMYTVMLLASITLALLWLHGLPLNGLLIAIVLWLLLCTGLMWLLHEQRRIMVFQADRLMVQWLGRGRACLGLHVLADRSLHNRVRSQKRWGEVSLIERINRVCGTQVPVEHERLTLVR